MRTLLVSACALAVCFGAPERVHAQGHGFTLPPGLAKKIPRPGPPPRNATERRTLEQKGRRIFFEETFGGNGRTCGTCHPATNNFTVDPAFIKRLPRRDPMFVHERVPALRELENAVELRRNALFCENVDSFDNDCMLRGVPHTLGLDASIKQSKRGIVHALGWSGDGSANDGSLREFAVGAVVQHFPKTLNRVVDVDFKMPTAEQLDALLAFQRSLGRSADVDLASLRFADDEANKGIRVFLNGGRPGGCHACHGNAGAIDNIGNNFNGNFATGTIKLRPDLPHDGGFGTDSGNGHGLGDQGFNVPSLIEAADTGPYFHNNGARTLEQAIAFYATEHFETSPSGLFGGKFVFEKGQERQIATLLRYLGVDDNINAAKAVLNEAAALGKKDKLRKELVLQARSDIADGIRVLSQIKGGDKAVIKRATGHLKKARAFANNKFNQSITALDAARATILAED